MKKILIFIFIFSTSCCLEEDRGRGVITIMSWNVQNLFDGTDDGEEYSEFSVSDGKWSEALYRKRMGQLSKIIKLNNPDIVAFQEIEGEVVLNDLKNEFLNGYDYVVSSKNKGAIKVGFLSKYPIVRVGIINPSDTVYGLRSILEVCIKINDMELVLINNHWKSKRGDFSEHLRLESSFLLKKRLLELEDSEIVVLGDLNENYDEYQRIGKSYPTALMFNETGGGIKITGGRLGSSSELYTPWPGSDYSGSYLFKDEWESIDHFLLNRKLMDKNDFYFKKFSVDNRNILFDKKGRIKKWITNFESGYSDHLPIILKLGYGNMKTTLE